MERMSPKPRSYLYLQSKRDKDGSDVMALLDGSKTTQKADLTKISSLAHELGIAPLMLDTITQAYNNPVSKANYPALSDAQKTRIHDKFISIVGAATKQEVKLFLEDLRAAYKELVESLPRPPSFKTKFPIYAVPTRSIAAITPAQIYIFHAITGAPTRKEPIEIYDATDILQLEHVADDFEPQQKAVANIIGSLRSNYEFVLPNYAPGLSKTNAELQAKALFKHNYTRLAAGQAPL